MMKKIITSLILSWCLIFTTTSVSQAKPQDTDNNPQFTRIEQPLSLKIVVTLGGLGLIGAELWWFLFSKTQSPSAVSNGGVQKIDVMVDGGYKPDRIVVKAQQPVMLNFIRKDPSSCLDRVLIPHYNKTADLVLNDTTSIEFTPTNTGEYIFHCGRNIQKGKITVVEN